MKKKSKSRKETNPTAYWRGVWFGAAINGEVEYLAEMVGDGVDLNIKDEDGWTASMFAAAYGRVTALRLLLGAGCALEENDVDGWTMVFYAATHSSASCLKILLKAG